MNLTNKNNYYFKKFDEKYATSERLGAFFKDNKIIIRVWQPLANNVNLLIFKYKENDFFLELPMKKIESYWELQIDSKYEGFSYQFKIIHQDLSTTTALDPYAKAIEPFNWEGDTKKVAKGVLIDINSKKLNLKDKVDNIGNFNNVSDPLIYELHIRDFTSGLSQEKFKNRLGTFNAALEKNIFGYLNDLSISHLQLLPITSIFTLDETDLNIVKKGKGKGEWITNYNWGYDPLNYFSLSNWYSSNPSDPYQGIIDFKNFVNLAHKKGIGIIVDVVYNHTMTNDIFNNLIRGYYYRDLAKVKPVEFPPLATQRKMVRKIIIDSLIHLVQTYNVDGFRFDLSGFIDDKTLETIAIELRKIKPNIILHGEAWKFSDLKFNRSWIKGVTTNNHNFAYFNDTIRDTIKGNEFDINKKGLVSKYTLSSFRKFTNCIIGNLNSYKFEKNIVYDKNKYSQFASNIGMTLNYVACHDGYTLWDRLNVSLNATIEEKLQMYKQALLASITCQGRYLLLAGTELLQSKPCDTTGAAISESHKSVGEQLFNDGADNKLFCGNTYKTTDFVNSIKWNHLEKQETKGIYEFCKKLFKFRQTTPFFRLSKNEEINKNIRILVQNKGVIIYKITVKNNSVIVMHNFTNKPYKTNGYSGYKVILNTIDKPIKTILQPRVSQILIKDSNAQN